MFGGLLITFREGLEAFLVIGIILSYLGRSNLQSYNKWVYSGAFLGLISAFLTGFLFQVYYNGYASRDNELYLKIGIMGTAVVVLTYMVIWMGKNSKNLRCGIEANIKKAVSSGAIIPLVLMGYLAVLREGFETVLFLGAVFGDDMSINVFYGGLAGVALALCVTIALFRGLRKVPLRVFFKITGILIMVIAAGLLNNMVGVMQDINIIPALIPHLFDLSWIMSDSSEVGIFFKALLGYTHSPSLLQVLSYIGYLTTVFIIMSPCAPLQRVKKRKAIFITSLVVLGLTLALLPTKANAYSYAIKEAPIDKIFKEGVVAAKKGDWDFVSSKAEEGISLQKKHHFKGDSLLPEFKMSIAQKDLPKTAENFAALVYLSIKEKLFQNKKNKLKDTKPSRMRLTLSRQSYLNILDGNVKKQDFALSTKILKSFDKALGSLGNPGLFGIGKRPPDLAAYNEASEAIDQSLLKAFPDFSRY